MNAANPNDATMHARAHARRRAPRGSPRKAARLPAWVRNGGIWVASEVGDGRFEAAWASGLETV